MPRGIYKRTTKMMSGKFKRTDRHNRINSMALKRAGIKPPSRLGTRLTEMHKKKISISLKGRSLTKEHKKNISLGRSGIQCSEKAKLKLSLFNKDKKLSEEHKKKIGLAHNGIKHWNWKGGISFVPYPIDWNELLKKTIRNRDGHKCQLCGVPEMECCGKLDVHHIDYNKDNLNPKNLISLCKNCHPKTNVNRDYWGNYFMEKKRG